MVYEKHYLNIQRKNYEINGNCQKKQIMQCVLKMQYIFLLHKYIQGVPGGKDLTSGECSLGQTIPI